MKNWNFNDIIFAGMFGTIGFMFIGLSASNSYITYKQYQMLQSAYESYNSCRALVAKKGGLIDVTCGKLPKLEDFKPQ